MTPRKSQLILLAAGKAAYNFFPLKGASSNTMVPVNGKPILWWISESLKKQVEVFESFKLVIDAEDKTTESYAKQLSLNWEIVKVKNSKSILESLQAGLNASDKNQSTSVILGDTLFGENLPVNGDEVLIQPINNTKRWCMATLNNGYITNLIDKPETWNDTESRNALCGYYHFNSTEDLFQSVSNAIQNGKKELSAAILDYAETHKIKGIQAKKWYDFGNIDKMVQSKHRLLQSRSFNSVTVDELSNSLTKRSPKKQKLLDEFHWYQQLPQDLKTFTPRIIDMQETDDNVSLKLEFYGYYTLSELYLYSGLDQVYWETIVKRLLDTYKVFCKHTKPGNQQSLKEIYLTKTEERLSKLQSEEWIRMLNAEAIVLNGEKLKSYKSLQAWIEEKVSELFITDTFSIIHGDWCFSNILFDLNGHVAKFIDPRGRFGTESIYGDPRYDMAKFRHSLHGSYDFIVNDLFSIDEVSDLSFRLNIEQNEVQSHLTEYFDREIEAMGFDSDQISLIEGLLFLTMIPLHADQPKRQKAMYLNAIKILNELYNKCA